MKLYLLCVLSALSCAALWGQAQSTAQIQGIVQDASGSAVPGAEVKAVQTDTGATRSAVTATDGAYVLANLPIGPYRIEISKQGFSTYVQTGIVLQVASNASIDASLKVGAVSDQVQVQADAALVETQNSGIGTVVDQQRVVDLPLNGRNATQLIFLAGAASTGQTNDLVSGKNYPTEQTISVAGGLPNGVTYSMDGGTHNDPMNNLGLPLPFPDALQEFKVETSALPALYGHHASAAVNAVTKSGTNAIHGAAFEFLRNGDFNARDFFAARRDTLKRNQFGGTVGGPIKKDKLFFFFGFQDTINRSDPPSQTAFIPTAAMAAGDFTAFASAACNAGVAKNLPAPFSGNKISPTLINGSALAIVKNYLPATADPCGRVQFSILNNTSDQQGLGRLDYQKSDKHSLFGRYFVAHYTQVPGSTGNVLATSQAGIDDIVHSFVLGDTYVFGPGLLNSFRGTLNQTIINKANIPYFSPTDVGVKMVAPLPKYAFITVTNQFGIGGGTASLGYDNTTSYEFADSVSWVKGTHQFTFGGDYIRSHLNGNNNLQTNGSFTFGGQTTGFPLADFMLGAPSAFTQSGQLQSYLRSNYISLYVQDAWKASARLTVNVGVRWEPFFPTSTKFGYASHFDPVAYAQNQRSTVYTKAPAGLTFPGDPGYPGTGGMFPRKGNFAPRLGLVWDPQGNGRMTVRASYGIFYDAAQLFYDDRFCFESLWGAVITLPSPSGGFSNPWASYPGGNPFPFPIRSDATFPVGGTYYNEPLHTKPPYLQQWNLSLQRQIGTNWLLSATYLGNTTTHLWTDYDANPAVFGPGASSTNTNARRILTLQNPTLGAGYATLYQLDDGGKANYNAMLLSMNRRLANNVTLQANYTWSHCITDQYATELGTTPYVIAGNRAFDHGNCDTQDRHHIVNLSAVAQSPRFSNRMLRALGSGWKISSIVSAQSGNYFSVTTGTDVALTAAANQRANLILPSWEGPNLIQYLNPAAFKAPATGTYGNLGVNSIRGPGMLQFDMGVSRLFTVHERKTLEFRWEVFNVLNRLNPSNPGTAINVGTFGKIQSDINASIGTTGDPRVMQAALKFSF